MPTAWPSIKAPDSLADDVKNPVVRTEYETGAVQTRVRFSTARSVFTLSWRSMTEADYQTLLTFFLANQALEITWTHPISAVSYTVRFQGDELKSEHLCNGFRKVGPVVLEQV